MTTNELAFTYGKAVARRERFAHTMNMHLFNELNQRCMTLWKQLAEEGAYADDERSVLKDEYRADYLRGLEG